MINLQKCQDITVPQINVQTRTGLYLQECLQIMDWKYHLVVPRKVVMKTPYQHGFIAFGGWRCLVVNMDASQFELFFQIEIVVDGNLLVEFFRKEGEQTLGVDGLRGGLIEMQVVESLVEE